jgi:hypothetical protein
MNNLKDQGLTEVQKQKVNPELDKLWDAIQHEVFWNRKNILGKLLTIIDAVIIDKNQNKSVKDLIKNAVWEDTERFELAMAQWFLWFMDNNKISSEDDCSSEPMIYDGPPMPSLANYIKK